MSATVKTLFYTYLETVKELKQPFTVLEHSTLNEKFNVFPNEAVPANAYPNLNYIAIGRGGHRGRIVSGSQTAIDLLQHNLKHAVLYEHLPFIIRPIAEDLSPSERVKYGMRTMIEIDGSFYFVYYLKRVSYTGTSPGIKELTVVDGVVTVENYVASPSQLNPTPIPYTNDTSNPATGKHLSVESVIEVIFSEEDIAEILNAVELIYGDPALATISEIATVTALPTTVNSTLGGVNANYDEALFAQIANHIPANIDLRYLNKEFRQLYTLGHTAPYVV